MPTALATRTVLLRPTLLQCLTLLIASLLSPQAAPYKRVALLLGDAIYGTAPLMNPPNDVWQMEAALK